MRRLFEAVGGVRLDSLFIDEGLGTLDPETLYTVAEVIETLGKSNRLVGIITHVPELDRRLAMIPKDSNGCWQTGQRINYTVLRVSNDLSRIVDPKRGAVAAPRQGAEVG
jgi:DNA repair exonuclease SbcCD ATPase subunit